MEGRLNSPLLAQSTREDARSFGPLVGESPSMRALFSLIGKFAGSDATVLITGESGTGKELVARALHSLGPRAQRPFVPVNCAAIPHELLESELFGHVRGAFTGAISARGGMFQLADGGTILLDEIVEMSLAVQAKLLRVLQNKEVRPVGSDRPAAVDVRVIAATNRDPAREVAKGAFREDLFYRLEVVPIHLPPLRARRSDIPLLVRHFIERARGKYDRSLEVSPEAMVRLWEYDWPGNVRELENLIEQLVILNDAGRIDAQDLPPHMRPAAVEKKLFDAARLENGRIDLRRALEEYEYRLIDEVLEHARGNKTAAAERLGLKRTTLVAKLRRRRRSRSALPAACEIGPQEG